MGSKSDYTHSSDAMQRAVMSAKHSSESSIMQL
jgi:hypothetical protein